MNAAESPRQRKRPIPSERNRRVWVEVVLAQRPQPEVAREFGISQQRVSQIIEQFQLWLAENLPPGGEGMTPRQQLSLAVNTAYLRQEHLYGDALRKLDQSVEDKHSLRIRYSTKGEELWRETLRENQSGKSGYLGAALNAVTREVRLVQMAAALLGPAMDLGWNFGQSVADPSAGAGPSVFAERADRISPLCNSAAIESADPPLATAPVAATPVAVSACRDGAERKLTPQGGAEFFAKPCAAARETGEPRSGQAGSASADPPEPTEGPFVFAERADHIRPLCESASPECEGKSFTLNAAALNDRPAATCEVSGQRNEATQEPRKLFANSCERMVGCEFAERFESAPAERSNRG